MSHLHRDHFDAKHLRDHISKDATVLLPEFPTSEMEDELRELGFTKFLKAPNEQVVELPGGLKIMIQALTSPTDGPIGDSSLWVEYDGVRLLNQNDARPADLTVFAELGHVHALPAPVLRRDLVPDGLRAAAGGPRPRSASRSGSGSSTVPCATSTT